MFSKVGVPGASGKEPASQCRRRKRRRFDHCVGKIPWRRAWQPTPVLLPGESHGQRSLEGSKVAKSQTCLKQQSTHACMYGTEVLFRLHHPSLSWRSCYKLFPRPSVPPGFVSSLPPEPLPHHISYPPISTPGLPPLCSISALPM